MSAAALPFAATAAGGGGAGETAADGGCAAPSTVAAPRALPVLGARRVATSALIASTGSGFRVRAAATTAGSGMSGSTAASVPPGGSTRSEEHTSELQSIMRHSYAVFCLKKKKYQVKTT